MTASLRIKSDRATDGAPAAPHAVGRHRRVRKPIILLGSGRSGTTLLGDILARHPDVAYWPEPRPIWMYRHAYRMHHELTASDLTPALARYIDRRFGRFLQRSGRARFAEKTPSNCLRIPFIHALYPDCRIVNIIRDGHQVVGGMVRMHKVGGESRRILARVVETPLWEWPAYIPMFFRTVWRTWLLRQPSSYWGIKPKGWQEWIGLPPHIIAARQWKVVVRKSICDGRALPSENYLELRYERFIQEPRDVLDEITDFADLPRCGEAADYARREIDPARAGRPACNLTARQLEEAEAEMQPLLKELGY